MHIKFLSSEKGFWVHKKSLRLNGATSWEPATSWAVRCISSLATKHEAVIPSLTPLKALTVNSHLCPQRPINLSTLVFLHVLMTFLSVMTVLFSVYFKLLRWSKSYFVNSFSYPFNRKLVEFSLLLLCSGNHPRQTGTQSWQFLHSQTHMGLEQHIYMHVYSSFLWITR